MKQISETRRQPGKMTTLALIATLGGLTLQSAFAASIVINSTDRGWHNEHGLHFPSNLNYSAGDSDDRFSPFSIRDFFVFDLSGITEDILSAELRLANPDLGFRSRDASETFTLFSVETAIPILIVGGRAATYDDLGTGTIYGSTVATAASNGTTITISLNAAFLAAATAAGGGSIAVGGAITTLDGDPLTPEHLFAWTNDGDMSHTQLVITTVPEPSTSLLIGAGAGTCVPSPESEAKCGTSLTSSADELQRMTKGERPHPPARATAARNCLFSKEAKNFGKAEESVVGRTKLESSVRLEL